MKINITIEIDDNELKGLLEGQDKPKGQVGYVKCLDVDSYVKASRLLCELKCLAKQYGFVTVYDYLELQDKNPEFKYYQFGWTEDIILKESKLVSDHGLNWRVSLPKPILIE